MNIHKGALNLNQVQMLHRQNDRHFSFTMRSALRGFRIHNIQKKTHKTTRVQDTTADVLKKTENLRELAVANRTET